MHLISTVGHVLVGSCYVCDLVYFRRLCLSIDNNKHITHIREHVFYPLPVTSVTPPTPLPCNGCYGWGTNRFPNTHDTQHLSSSLSISLSLSLSVHIYIYIYVCVCLSLSLSLYIYIYCLSRKARRLSPSASATTTTAHLQICVYIYIYTHVYTCVYIYIYIYT